LLETTNLFLCISLSVFLLIAIPPPREIDVIE
jgi:hypothetical protein